MQFRLILISFLLAIAVAVLFIGGWLRFRADEVIGKRLVENNCGVCHDLTSSKQRIVGPFLWGVFGRHAGSVDFPYSDAFVKRATDMPFVWNEETLGEFIRNPNQFVPQTRMTQSSPQHPLAFEGMDSSSNRRDVIAFLKTLK